MRRWIPGPTAAVSAVLVGVCAWTASWLFRGAPDLSRAPGWFYQAVNKGSFDMLLVAAGAAALPSFVRASFRLAGPRPWAAIGCVVAGSIVLQLAVGLVARHQVRGWTERFFVGHGEFTWRAKEVPDALALLRNYETLAAQNQLGLYGPSKPPGTYAVYLALDRTSRWKPVEFLMSPLAEIVALDPAVPPDKRTLFAWTIVALGLCAALTAVPLFWLARWLFDPDLTRDSARVFTFPAWLFVAAPVTNVITVHLDGSVFPLLSAASSAACAGSVRLAAAGRRTRAALFALAGGGFATFAVYCSYGNLPILAIGFVLVTAIAFEQRGAVARTLAMPLLGLTAGTLLTLAVLRLGFEWQPIAGYLRGVGYHQRWRPNLPSAWRHGLAFLEFSLFAGPPLIAAFLASSVRAGVELGRAVGRFRWTGGLPAAPFGSFCLSIATAALIVAISLAIGTPEAARLWMFMLPWICCAAGFGFARASLQPAFNVLLVTQVVLTFFVKNYLVW